MFLAFLVIPTLLGPFSSIPSVKCQGVNGNLLNSIGTRVGYQDIIFAPFATPTPALQLYQVGYPQLIIPPPMENPTKSPSKSFTRKKSSPVNSSESSKENSFNQRSSYRHSPPRTSSRVRNPYTKNYGYSSSTRYKTKGGRYSKASKSDSTKKNFYMSLVQKLLKPRPKKKEYSSSSSIKFSAPPSKQMQTSASAMSAPAGGKGWGWGGGGGGSKISLLDLLLLKLTMLSLLGFLLNLLLNLASLFGFGFMTSTATYPVTMTTTEPATATGTATTGQALTYPTAGWALPASAASASGSGLDDITARTLNSMVGNGWGWPSDQARLKLHVKLPSHGWNATTTTTAPTELPPSAIDPSLTANVEEEEDYLLPLSPSAKATTRSRPKRETFKPYVDPTTSLEIFSKAVLNSMESAINRYDCMEKIHCENNKQARVVGQWLDYFMPVYSFSLSLIGHRMEIHHSLFDHLRAIVLGATETNCKAHFPHCEPSDKGTVK